MQLARTLRKQLILSRLLLDLLGLMDLLMYLGYVAGLLQADEKDQKLIKEGTLALHTPK